MALASFRWRRILRTSISTLIGCGCIGAVGTVGLSALLNWDPSGVVASPGGTGTWDYTSLFWDDNGTLPNVRWSDVTGVDTAVFKGTASLVHVGAVVPVGGVGTAVTAGGLRFDVTGSTIDNNGSALNTLSLVTAGAFGPAPLIASNAAGVTSTISASLLGNDGLQFSAGSFTGTKVTLSGDNKFIGGVSITSGTVELGSAGALNQSIRNDLTFGSSTTTSSALRLNGNSVAIRDLIGTSATSSITNGGASDAILTVYQQNDQVVKTNLSDGGAGKLELVKAGPGVLTLTTDNPYTGATTVRGSTQPRDTGSLHDALELAGNGTGRLTGTAAINLYDGGVLRLTNSSSANSGDRIPAVPINLRGGTLAFSNDGSANSFAETAGALAVQAGTNYIVADQAASGQTSVLTFTSMVRSPGSVVVFQSQSSLQGSSIPLQIGIDTRDRVVFTAAPALNDSLIGGWAVMDNLEFATYNTTTFASVKTVTSAFNLAETSWSTSQNVKLDQPQTTIQLTADRTVNSLNIAVDPVTLNLSSQKLNIDTGGLISQVATPFGGVIMNGFLTAGTTNGAELIFTVPNQVGTLEVSAGIVNNDAVGGVGGVNLTGVVKSGAGTLLLDGTNTFTGPTSIVGGTIQIDSDSRLGGFPVSNTNTLRLYDGTLLLSSPTNQTLDSRRTIEVGGNSVISLASGSTATGRTWTYNGTIISPGGNTGSLTFLSNATEDSTGAFPGTISANLIGALNLGGSLRIDAATQFRVPGSVANSIGRSLQIGMNGTATFSQSGNTLSIGAGVDDTLDIGVKDLTTFSSVPHVGTLTLTGVTQFTAKVDQVRIGVQLQDSETLGKENNTAGTATLATNNDITAGTSITVSDNANANGIALGASTVTFGAGTNNVTTQSFTLGGRKGNATATVPAGGTLNLKGFADRTLNLSIGRSDNADTSTISNGTLNASTATSTLVGSFDTIIIGQKTGSTIAGGANGTMTLGTSPNNSVVANSVKIGVDTDFNGTATSTTKGDGTLNFGGGSFTVYNDVAMATQTVKGIARGALNVSGGTFNVGGNITKTNNDLSNAVISVSGGTLNMTNPLVNDLTAGTITASQLNYTGGSITGAASVTLDGRGLPTSATPVPLDNALIIRDVSLPAQLNLTGTVANKGGVQYQNTGAGAGGTLAGVSLGSVARTFDVADSANAAADLTISGAITGTGLLTKQGAGTLQLNGAVAGPVTVSAGGLTAANGIGAIATGALTFAQNTKLTLEINSTAQTTDRINITGNLSLDNANTVTLEISDLVPGPVLQGSVLLFLDYTGSWNGGLFKYGTDVIADFDANLNPNSTVFFVSGHAYRMDYDYNGGDGVALLAVPEPGSLALLAGGAVLLGARRRRKGLEFRL
jgi:autotransporter-associated beta strand protein